MDQNAEQQPLSNPTQEEIDEILAGARTIAVVGLSDKPDRDSFVVARYLQQHGYRIIPVNPAAREILGERAYPDVAAIPLSLAIDVVDIFRRPEFIPEAVAQAVAHRARAVWMQLGLHHEAAAGEARAAGLQVVQDRCIKVEHARFAATRRDGLAQP